jgi:hypothetical protein
MIIPSLHEALIGPRAGWWPLIGQSAMGAIDRQAIGVARSTSQPHSRILIVVNVQATPNRLCPEQQFKTLPGAGCSSQITKMVVDPFTALGLAGNIVQFVDFLCKLLSESRSLYESSTGASDDNIVLEKIANDLSLLTSELTTSSSPAVLPASSELLETATLCKQVAAELSQALDELKVKGPHKKWKSFVQALRSVMKKEQIQALARRLDTVQRQLNTRLLVLLSCVHSLSLSDYLLINVCVVASNRTFRGSLTLSTTKTRGWR